MTEGLKVVAKWAGLVLAYWACFAAAVAGWLAFRALAAWAWGKRIWNRGRRNGPEQNQQGRRTAR